MWRELKESNPHGSAPWRCFRDSIWTSQASSHLEHATGVEPVKTWFAIKPLLLFAFACITWYPAKDLNLYAARALRSKRSASAVPPAGQEQKNWIRGNMNNSVVRTTKSARGGVTARRGSYQESTPESPEVSREKLAGEERFELSISRVRAERFSRT